MTRVGASLLIALLVGLAPHSATALFPPRYAACQDESERRTVKLSKQPTPLWLPLPKKRIAPLRVAPMEVDDVAHAEAMPSRRVAPREKPPTRVVLVQSRNDYRCVGIPRGTPGILRVISAPPGARFYRHNHPNSWRQRNMRAAGVFNLKSAVPALRRELARPIPKDAEPWLQHQLRRNKHYAARALADMGDRTSGPAVLALLRSLERDGFNLWRDTLDTLLRLEPRRAQAYALDLIRRATRDPKLFKENSQLLTDVLPLVTTPSAGARDVIERAAFTLVTDDAAARGHFSGACELVAARVRMGNTQLQSELRHELATDLRTQRAVACYSKWMPVLFPGHDSREADAWMHRHRYLALLNWLARTRKGEPSQNDVDARRRLLSWLKARAKKPDIVKNERDRRYSPNKRALHLAALAAMGERSAKSALDTLIRDPADDGTAPWIAALHALRLELPAAADLAAERLRLGIRQSTRRFSSKRWDRRGAVNITEQGHVIEELARRGDARFALGLLSRSVFDRELTAMLVARRKPARACEIVGNAAAKAQRQAVDDAFWSLSVLGSKCRATMQRLTKDSSQPPSVRGMANEYLAMLRDKSVPSHTAVLLRDRDHRASAQRARIIFSAKE